MYVESTMHVIHSQKAKLKYTGTPRARHERLTQGSSGNTYWTYAWAKPASKIGNTAALAKMAAYSRA